MEKTQTKNKKCKLGDVCKYTSVTQPYHRRGSEGGTHSRWAIFCYFLLKLAILMPLDQISHVLRAIRKN